MIDKLTLAIGGCAKSRNCSFVVIEIGNNLNYKHYCFDNCGERGLFKSRISKNDWEKINADLSACNFSNINNPFEFNRIDEYVELMVVKNLDTILLKSHKLELPKQIQQTIDNVSLLRSKIEIIRDTIFENRDFDLVIPMNNYFSLPYPINEQVE